MKSLVKIIISIVIAAAVSSAISLYVYKNHEKVPEAAPTAITETIELSFKDIAELAVEEYDFTNIGSYTSDKAKLLGIRIPFTEKSFILSYDGKVKAGIHDISEIEYYFDDSSKVLHIVCPDVVIFDGPYIDSTSIKLYDQKNNVFNQISIDDYTQFISSEEDKCINIATDSGLLIRAENRAENALTAQAKALLLNTSKNDYAIDVIFH